MKKLCLSASHCLVVLLAVVFALPESHAQGVWKPHGFAQLTAEKGNDQDGIDFGGDRIRAGARYHSERLSAGLILDFNVSNGGDKTPGTLNNVIKDVYVAWKFNPMWSGKFGQFKMPVGMDFDLPGAALDITKRAMEKPLVLERNLGLMFSGRNLPLGLGLDVGLFNPAGRSGATNHQSVQEGEDNSYAARLLWQQGDFHFETAIGQSEQAGGPGTEDYTVWNVAGRYTQGAVTLKAELVSGSDVLGTSGRDEQVAYAHVGYRLKPDLELVLRHYHGESDTAAGASSSLGNSFLGVNWWPAVGEAVAARLQFNYVLASGDEAAYTGLGGFKDDAVLCQLQLSLK